MNKIVITGALGHIGSKLIRTLPLSVDSELILVDNFLTQRYCSLFNLSSEYKYTFIEADILNDDLESSIVELESSSKISYDQISSNILSGESNAWNYNNDGSLLMFGTQYQATKGVKFNINYRLFTHNNSIINNKSILSLNAEFKI